MKELFLRRETKRNEQRACLSPQICKQLLPYFDQIVVESCPQRIFKDQEYTDLGITIGTKPQNCIVIGLKELPESNEPITDTHVMFAHCYKNQDGWQQMVSRFKRGNGLLLDLEFLMENNRRVAAFGYYAGFAGAALALDVWAHKQLFPGKEYPKVNPFANQEDLYASVRNNLALAKQKVHKQPRVMVMGALGRCGSGACDFVMGAGIPAENLSKWDMAETAKGGPFNEIIQHDIFVNCIYLATKIPPFLTKDMLDLPSSQLEVISDVSCDATNPNNPIPVYYGATTFDQPLIHVPTSSGKVVDVIAIDHLPSMIPREASEQFGKDLLPTLQKLSDYKNHKVWTDAEALFEKFAKLV